MVFKFKVTERAVDSSVSFVLENVVCSANDVAVVHLFKAKLNERTAEHFSSHEGGV